VAPKI